ncbi:MAG: hypothetical protein QFE16_10800 [Pseudomonadota bacterium]|nr:hypothetical protein [Pseudomonadota bacterium]
MPTSLQPSPSMRSSASTFRIAACCAMAALFGLMPLVASAEADKAADKAARRLQLQMQNLQQQVQEAQAAKTKVEADKAEVDKQLIEQAQQVTRLKGALRKAADSLKVSEAGRVQALATVASLEKQMAEQQRSHEDVLAQKARELVQFTRLRDDQQAQLQRRHDDQVTLVGECTVKNDKLIHLSVELVDRYRGKTVGDVVKQREPLLGLGDIEMFNLVQDYRDKADAERFTAPVAPPAADPSSSPPPPINR